MDHQDWKPVVLTKRPVGKKPVSKDKIPVSGLNKNFTTQGTGKKVNPDDDEIKSPPTVGLTIGKQIASARNLKKITQKQLAAQMNITAQDVQLNENGKALKNNSLLARFEKALGTRFKR
tara:strand:+ start:1632 stop:1988 length:357 start_codon:yes stop_codon:yes gene_type:complete